MKHEVAKIAWATLISIFLGFGPVWETRSETPSDVEKTKFFDNVGKLFVWKPDKSTTDPKKEVSKKEQKNESRVAAPKAKRSGEKAESDREGDSDTGKTPFSFLANLGKKNQTDEASPSVKKGDKPASVPAGSTEKKKVTAETAEVEPAASRKPFSLFAGFGKKEKATASPMPAGENKVVESPAEKPAPVATAPSELVATAPSEPVATVPAKKKQEPVADSSPKMKSFQLFGKRDREEPVLPDIYDGLSGDEALELAMERARAKLEAQKTPDQ